MVRPPPGLVTSAKEAASRAISTTTKGGASKLIRPGLKFQRPIHSHATPHTSSSATATAQASRVHEFLETIYRGVFQSVKSGATARPGPYTGQRLAAHARPLGPSGARPFSSGRLGTNATRPRASGFGPTPRPVAQHGPRTTNVGLGSARTFSSSGFAVFENVVHNAPLALRALADHGREGIDERKWRRLRREIREKERTDVKGKGIAIDHTDLRRELQKEFEQFFSAEGVASQANNAEATADALAIDSEVEPLALILVLDPEMPFSIAPPPPPSDALVDPSRELERLLPASVLTAFETVTDAYTTHSHRLRTIVNRLSAAGLLDDESASKGEMFYNHETGKRLWRVEFGDGFLTRSRLEDVVRGGRLASRSRRNGASSTTECWQDKVESWTHTTDALGNGYGAWWWIEGGDDGVGTLSPHSSFDLDHAASDVVSPIESFSSSRRSTQSRSSTSSTSTTPDETNSFVLPILDLSASSFETPSATASSLDLSPPLSPSMVSDSTTWWSAPISTQGGHFLDTGDDEDDDLIEFDTSTVWDDSVDEHASTVSWNDEVAVEDTAGIRTFLDEIELERARLLETDRWR